jgi:hypothetical protein
VTRKYPVTFRYLREIKTKHLSPNLAHVIEAGHGERHGNPPHDMFSSQHSEKRIKFMKKAIQAVALTSLLASAAAFAHHPAADIVDPETYEMIDENVADTPHADMVFDDMGN